MTEPFVQQLLNVTRLREGWPTRDFLTEHLSCSHLGHVVTVEGLMERYPPERFPGFYDRSVCPVCHGSGECERCGGTGFVCPSCRNLRFVKIPKGAQRWFRNGRSYGVRPCEQCDELQREVATTWAATWSGGGLTDEEQAYTFDNGLWNDESWSEVRGVRELKKTAAWLRYWAGASDKSDKKWIVMLNNGSGNVGAGKSYLCTSIVHEALARGVPAFKWSCDVLMNWLRERQSPRSDVSYAGWLNSLMNFPGILILDEFGLARSTPFVEETFGSVLTHRGGRRWLPTVIAGNAYIGDVRMNQPWLGSRLSDHRVLVLDLSPLPDWRPLIAARKREIRPVPDKL